MGRLRIIAGELRGRRIDVPRDATLRPTADRVREALFSILGRSVEGARVLDAYAGSGALGFEALSRGAARVVFVESDRETWEALRATAGRLGVVSRCALRLGRVGDLVGRAIRGPFDLVLADPPYEAAERGRLLGLASDILAPGGCIVVERDAGATLATHAALRHDRTAAYGRVRLDFYRSAMGPGTAEKRPG